MHRAFVFRHGIISFLKIPSIFPLKEKRRNPHFALNANLYVKTKITAH
jgi:hypothetical protein